MAQYYTGGAQVWWLKDLSTYTCLFYPPYLLGRREYLLAYQADQAKAVQLS